MPANQKQKIVVLLSQTDSDQIKIQAGIKMAALFKKELCLVYHCGGKEKSLAEGIGLKLNLIASNLADENPDLKISTLVLTIKKRKIAAYLADAFEAILIILFTTEFEKFALAFRNSFIPFLFINQEQQLFGAFKKIILPVDFRSGNKEAALWGSYFGRYSQAVIQLFAANDKNKSDKRDMAKNIKAATGIFNKFKISHSVVAGNRSSFENSFEALEYAQKQHADLLIALGSSVITPLDWIIGTSEKRMLKNADKLPVLFINPRKDNYILCD